MCHAHLPPAPFLVLNVGCPEQAGNLLSVFTTMFQLHEFFDWSPIALLLAHRCCEGFASLEVPAVSFAQSLAGSVPLATLPLLYCRSSLQLRPRLKNLMSLPIRELRSCMSSVTPLWI